MVKMIKQIILKGSQILKTKCKEVTNFNSIQNTIDDMIDTIEHLKTTYEFTRGIGLTAPQIGEIIRIAVIEYNKERYILVNPEIIEKSEEKHLVWEGCLGFFEFRAYVPRFTYVKVKTYDRNGKEYFIEGTGDLAASLQHEIDHLNGILYIDHLPNGEKDLIKSQKP